MTDSLTDGITKMIVQFIYTRGNSNLPPRGAVLGTQKLKCSTHSSAACPPKDQSFTDRTDAAPSAQKVNVKGEQTYHALYSSIDRAILGANHVTGPARASRQKVPHQKSYVDTIQPEFERLIMFGSELVHARITNGYVQSWYVISDTLL